jgi:class 3 adenylate cyclase/tetratricopeptide (TPR) repeat protein
VERKLASVLFVDLVDSTAEVARTDPEVVRVRINRFFDQVEHCVISHGGIVEKFAGDAVMAAFGIPQAHEDDAERAVRASIAILCAVHDLDLEARIGVEAGEVVAETGDSTFATGEAVNLAARLQQAAEPGEILIGPAALRLTTGRIEAEPVGPLELRGLETVEAWRVLGQVDDAVPPRSLSAPLVGRESELDLLELTFERAARDRRAHLFTVYGEAGIGKSRLAREFAAGLDGATVLAGRCLPYGEGITYWPLAEMVKTAVGIADDDPAEEAFEKLRESCEDEAVADLLALATGVLEAVGGERSQQEIAWAVREWAEQMAQTQPLVLVFEDIHWAEEPLLELIEHVAAWVRSAPLLLLCLARPELLDLRPGWGGGKLRATAIELEPLVAGESEELAAALLAEHQLPADVLEAVLEKTEGNPLFVEETIRMLMQDDGDDFSSRIPDTLQALIAARIDRLQPDEKLLLQRAAVIGRTFWANSVRELLPDEVDVAPLLDDLLLRDFIVREQRSSITGEEAYRFKHVLIKEVAYAGLSKSSRADLHRRFAAWLHGRVGEELTEIRGYHLDQACRMLTELDGAPPADLASETAAVLESAGRRALAREANASARKLLLRSVELQPTLERRYNAARAAWKLSDLPSTYAEMEDVCAAAAEAGNRRIETWALIALAESTLFRNADVENAAVLAERAFAIVPEDDGEARFALLELHSVVAKWRGDMDEAERYLRSAGEAALAARRADLESKAATELGQIYILRGDLACAATSIERGAAMAEESGSIVARAWARRAQGELAAAEGSYAEAARLTEESRGLFAETGTMLPYARTTNALARIFWWQGDVARAERLYREAVKLLNSLEDRGTLCESQRLLAQLLLEQGRVDEAERYAVASLETVGEQDVSSAASTRMALGQVRAAQGRDAEAEKLLREAVEVIGEVVYLPVEVECVRALSQFLRERGREDDAAPYEARLVELAGGSAPSTAPMA